MALTREQALEELLRNQRELDHLIAHQADLKKIVLLQEIPPISAKKTYARTLKSTVGTENERTLKVLIEHGGALTTREVVTLLGGNYTDNRVRQTLERLLGRGFVNKSKDMMGRTIYQTVIHPDKSEKEVANDE